MRKIHSDEEKGLLKQCHSMNIEKLPKQINNKFSNVEYWIRCSVGAEFKIIISQKANATESNLSDESLEGYTSRFRKNIFRPKYTDVQSYRIYRYVATSAKHLSVANMTEDSVVNATNCSCQLSRLRRDSHACGLKTSISRRLTLACQFLTPDWKMCVVAVLLHTISKSMLTQTHVRKENHV